MEITVSNVDVTVVPEAEADLAQGQETDAAYDLILLNPTKVQLFRTGGSTVRATITDPTLGADRSFRIVRIARAFPLSKPDTYIGLRNGDDKDIGMLPTLDGLDADSRRIVDEELERRYFVPRVLKVINLKDEFGNFTWTVETDKGPRTFVVTGMRDNSYEVSSNRVLVTDKDGVRYEFPDVSKLDAKSVALFARIL